MALNFWYVSDFQEHGVAQLAKMHKGYFYVPISTTNTNRDKKPQPAVMFTKNTKEELGCGF